MAAAARTPKYMYKTAPGNSGELSIEYGTDLGALTRLEVSLFANGQVFFVYSLANEVEFLHKMPLIILARQTKYDYKTKQHKANNLEFT